MKNETIDLVKISLLAGGQHPITIKRHLHSNENYGYGYSGNIGFNSQIESAKKKLKIRRWAQRVPTVVN